MVLDESLDVTHLELTGDWNRAGLTYEADGSQGVFSASGNGNYASIDYGLGNENWSLTFGAPSGQTWRRELIPSRSNTNTLPTNRIWPSTEAATTSGTTRTASSR